jgi:hypothetical protein
MQTITKDDFLSMVRLQHLEVITQSQLVQNTNIIKGYMEKALTSELSEIEKADSNEMIAEVGGMQQWCVLRNDFSKAVVYTRREQIAWDEPERGEFGEILKARGGVYKLTGVNKKLGRVGQKYGEANSNETDAIKHRTLKEQAKEWPAKYKKEGGEKKELSPSMKKLADDLFQKKKDDLKKQGRDYMPDQDMSKEEIEKEQNKGGKKLSTAEVDKLHDLVNYSRKEPNVDDVEQTAITPEIKALIDRLPVHEQGTNFLSKDCPKEAKGNPYIAEVNGTRFLIDPQGYEYPRYVTKLVKKVTPVE